MDGPPWVKYIALHPEKGIALIDLLPAQPETAVAPLEEFLARTGFGAFSRGDPPIVAVALAADDIATVGEQIDEAFGQAPSCGIKNTNWPAAIAELLMSTQGLLLTQLENAAVASAQKIPLPPVKDRPRDAPTAPRKIDAAAIASAPPEPVFVRVHDDVPVAGPPAPRPPVAPQPSGTAARKPAGDQAPLPKDTVIEKSAASTTAPALKTPPRKQASTETVKSTNTPQIDTTPSEPSRPRKPKPAKGSRPVLAVKPEAVTNDDRPLPIDRRDRPVMLWIIAASLSAIAAVAVFYPHSPIQLSDLRQTLNGAAPVTVEPPSIAAATTPATPPSQPTPSASPAPPPSTSDASTGGDPAPSHALRVDPPPVFSEVPTHNVMPVEPARPPAATLPPPQRDAGVAMSNSVPAPQRSAPPKRVKQARAKIYRDDDEGSVSGLLPPSPPQDDNTVTIDGTTYVKGREPHALGTLPPGDPDTEPQAAPPPAN
jgi:hypothetical protein